jgi:hypothetical protein
LTCRYWLKRRKKAQPDTILILSPFSIKKTGEVGLFRQNASGLSQAKSRSKPRQRLVEHRACDAEVPVSAWIECEREIITLPILAIGLANSEK